MGMEKEPNLKIQEKTRAELDSQVKHFDEDLYPPSTNREEILSLSEIDLKSKYTRRYEIYKKLLRSANSGTKDLSPDELIKMKKWLTALNGLDTYIANHNKEIQDSGLWDRQFTVFEDIREFLEKGGNSGYVKLPTRSGKTVIFTKLIEALSMKTVIVVPNQNLVTQTEEKITQFSSDLDVGKVYSKAKEFGRDVTITTYSSLVKMVKRGQIKPAEVDCLILDEVHRGLSEMRMGVINQFKDSFKLGFSATPSFSKTKGAEKILQTEIHSLSLAEASMEGLLAPFSVIVAETDVDISNVKVLTTGDYNSTELSQAVNLKSRNRAAIELYKKMFPNQRCIAYCVDIKHAEDFSKECNENGIKSRVVSTKHTNTNQQNIEDYKKGDISILSNVDILTEGFDDPGTSICLNLRPTFSRVVAEQRGGRVLTLDPDNPSKHAYIVEFLDKNNWGKRSLTFYDVIEMTENYLDVKTIDSIDKSGKTESYQPKTIPKIDGLRVYTDIKEVLKILKRNEAGEKKLFSSEPLHNDYMDDRFISLNNISTNELKNVAKSLEIDLISEPLYKTDPVLQRDMRKQLYEALATLNPREEKVIKWRFFNEMTLEQIAEHIGVTRERIRQIEIKAIRKLRHRSRFRYLKTFEDLL